MNRRLALFLIALALFAGLVGPPLVSRAVAAPPSPEQVLFNDAVLANTDLLTDLQPPANGPNCAYRITIALASTNSVLNWVVKSGATVVATDMNSGTALTAGNTYTFVVGASRESTAAEALTYNLRVETGTTITILVVDRVTDGAM